MECLEWSGPLTHFEQSSIDGFVIASAKTDTPYTSLPLPMKYQDRQSPGHDNCIVGLAKIDRVWCADNSLYGAGTFHEDDPEAVLLAKKVEKGYINQVSVDLGGCSLSAAEDGSVRVDKWQLTSATLCADPKFHSARIALTRAESTAPDLDAMVAEFSGRPMTFSTGARITLARPAVTVTASSGRSLNLARARVRLMSTCKSVV